MITEKSVSAYKTISEVSTLIDVPSHVLRFWETKFSQVKPIKRSGGRRYYRLEDIKILSSIRELLYQEGYTIKGAQKVLKSHLKSSSANDKTTLGTNSSNNSHNKSGLVKENSFGLNSGAQILELLRDSDSRLGKLISQIAE